MIISTWTQKCLTFTLHYTLIVVKWFYVQVCAFFMCCLFSCLFKNYLRPINYDIELIGNVWWQYAYMASNWNVLLFQSEFCFLWCIVSIIDIEVWDAYWQVNPHTHQLKVCDFGSAKMLVCIFIFLTYYSINLKWSVWLLELKVIWHF